MLSQVKNNVEKTKASQQIKIDKQRKVSMKMKAICKTMDNVRYVGSVKEGGVLNTIAEDLSEADVPPW